MLDRQLKQECTYNIIYAYSDATENKKIIKIRKISKLALKLDLKQNSLLQVNMR